ncbi:MAG TPA: DNA repair protein RadA [Thermoanaerobaculia bacterium]|nr:DNA repair protein RadA [Thermoanaerobaculia bacterium]
MAKKATIYACTECGAQAQKWLGRCPDCNAWNSYAQEDVAPAAASPATAIGSAGAPMPIGAIDFDVAPRLSTHIASLDRVLGGGLVIGAVTLVGGEPGIGKSTLLLQAAEELSRNGIVLYVSGEESPRQIAMRARRLGTMSDNIRLFTETSVERILAEVEKIKPAAVIVDSIQTVHTSANQSMPGSVGQVRDSAGVLMSAAKRMSVPIFLIGHITKEGTIAGPKALEHIVDTVLYFEGEKFQNYRVVRAYKNRFGPVNEVAIFEMHDDGLQEVPNPSAALISQRSQAPGSAILCAVEGTRPLLIEVQALVSATHFPSPRRMAMGIDANRVSLLLAVMEKKSGSNFVQHDIYVNVAGGLQIDEPALDLGVVAAVLSSQRNVPIAHDVALFGEVGLLGEIRSVSQPDLRAREAAALGFRRVILPQSNASEIRADVEVVPVRRMEDVAGALFGNAK